jgi:hypothetical protein
MNCADFEVLLCDYLDGTLDASQRSAIEEHRGDCAYCASFAADVESALAALNQAQPVEPPPELLTRITFEIPTGGQHTARRGWRSLFAGWLQPVLQPRFAMGMAMTILSFSMLARIAGIEIRDIRPADLHPAKVWAATDDKVHRVWNRAVKYYENLRLVYEVQTRVREWTQQEQEERKGAVVATPAVPPAVEGKEQK